MCKAFFYRHPCPRHHLTKTREETCYSFSGTVEGCRKYRRVIVNAMRPCPICESGSGGEGGVPPAAPIATATVTKTRKRREMTDDDLLTPIPRKKPTRTAPASKPKAVLTAEPRNHSIRESSTVGPIITPKSRKNPPKALDLTSSYKERKAQISPTRRSPRLAQRFATELTPKSREIRNLKHDIESLKEQLRAAGKSPVLVSPPLLRRSPRFAPSSAVSPATKSVDFLNKLGDDIFQAGTRGTRVPEHSMTSRQSRRTSKQTAARTEFEVLPPRSEHISPTKSDSEPDWAALEDAMLEESEEE